MHKNLNPSEISIAIQSGINMKKKKNFKKRGRRHFSSFSVITFVMVVVSLTLKLLGVHVG